MGSGGKKKLGKVVNQVNDYWTKASKRRKVQSKIYIYNYVWCSIHQIQTVMFWRKFTNEVRL